MKIDVLTLFPNLVENYLSTSILGIAKENKIFQLATHNPRDFTKDKHKAVDDSPYGGGSGMLLSPQPFFDCLEEVLKSHNLPFSGLEEAQLNHEDDRDYEIILTSPSGEPWSQELAQEFSQKSNLIILCGRYEGFDQRIRNIASREISMGDFVLTGGELAAMTIIDSSVRLIPGALGDDESKDFESFSTINYLDECKKLKVSKREMKDLLDELGMNSQEELASLTLVEHPHYTRPANFRGEKIPEVLESGDHKKIFLWRLKEAIKLTRARNGRN